MIGKIGRFFEEHIEKIILVIVGLVCAFLLITRVILSPNVVEYENEKFSPSVLDNHILKEAQNLGQKLGEPPADMEPYKPKLDDYLALMNSSVRGVDVNLSPPLPSAVQAETALAGSYRLPAIGKVEDVAVELIRTVAYVPIVPVTPEAPYDKAGNEPNDLDFVTVEAKYDVQGLYDRFKEKFMIDVEPQYADPCLAKPVFAAVNLQRQEMTADGGWGDWQDVPRAKIDSNAQLFRIVENVKELPPGGMKVQLLQYDYKDVQISLLQPEPYQIASAREEWFPPSLHSEFLDFQRKELLEERRDAKEAEKEQRQQETDQRRTRRTDTGIGGAGGAVGGRSGGGYDQLGGAGGGGYGTNSRSRSRDRSSTRSGTAPGGLPGDNLGTSSRRRSSNRRTTGDSPDALYDMAGDYPGALPGQRDQRRPSINDVYIKYSQIALTMLTDFSKIREPLVFWAHDDTVEPEKTYRYRIRLGVFNPVAGQNRLDEQYKSMNDQVILWSDFSDVTDPVSIMGRLYFFATNLRESDNTVTVQVSKLALGRWYSHDFPVKEGEIIGSVMENEPPKPDKRSTTAATAGYPGYAGIPGAMGAPGTGVLGPGMSGRLPSLGGTQQSEIPETVDYSTGAVMVDAVAISDWSGDKAMRMRHYYDMLYSFDGANIEHMPIRSAYWPKDVQAVYSQIGKLQREPQEPFKAFGSSKQRQGAQQQDMYYDDMGYQDMMMEGLGAGGPPAAPRRR